jgi:glyoxylase-like metal-dependent hydrolase (beta-lactamase superfamily II)
MRLESISTGNFKLDGGAMFGSVPKSIWNRLYPADENNMCNWAMRCLFVEDGNRKILIDTGIGDKQSEKFFSYYYLNGNDSLMKSLSTIGVTPEDITDVILTHLHFDHCGGATAWNSDKDSIRPVFSKAKYWSHKDHWAHALNSNPREKASFLKENLLPLEESGQLHFVDSSLAFNENIRFHLANGHTESMLVPEIQVGDKRILYGADLVPSAPHIPANYVMAYDIRPLESMKERAALMDTLVDDENTMLFFEHDAAREGAFIGKNERGKHYMKAEVTLKDFLGS